MLGKIYKKTEEEINKFGEESRDMEGLFSKMLTEIVFTRFLVLELMKTLSMLMLVIPLLITILFLYTVLSK